MSDPRSDLSKHSDPAAPGELTRRTLVKRGLLAGGALAGSGLIISELLSGGSSPHSRAPVKVRSRVPSPVAQVPNILVILVDQLRSNPRWISRDPIDTALMPNLARLSREGVNFASHYTASNDCTPARSTLLTGLYTHQTGCMITGGSTLDPGFPTWGSMLREQGYETYWYGKWHLTHRDNHWNAVTDSDALEPYGFSGGTYPSPDGAPGQGWRVDPYITSQFESWFAEASERQPWCTTVSFINPHDIAWWYRWSDRFAAERPISVSSRPLPVNFETPEQLLERGKPALQRSLQETAAQSFGVVPFSGPQAPSWWGAMMDLYTRLRSEVDGHIGGVLETLASRPSVAANTVVVFTSDHGEYGGAHGLRGKGAGAYEEAIRVPLVVRDPRGTLNAAPGQIREQLSSSVDVAPLLMSIASGSQAWREESRYAHLANRLDITGILTDPSARGRSHV
ncbi:MAG: sulfatase-like hydrolase/transferase, partial [Solirubrobacteraceae bacterium]